MKKIIALSLALVLLLGLLVLPASAATPRQAYDALVNIAKGGVYEDDLYHDDWDLDPGVYYGVYYYPYNDKIEVAVYTDELEVTLILKGDMKTPYVGYVKHYEYESQGNVSVNPGSYTQNTKLSFTSYSGKSEIKSAMLDVMNSIMPEVLDLTNYILAPSGCRVRDLGFTNFTKHEYHHYDEGKVTTPPTCVGYGTVTYTCLICGTTYTDSVVPNGIHTWNAGTVTKQPTCTQTGQKTFTCTVCGATHNELIPALGHAWTVTEVKSEGAENEDGTFTHGKAVYTCTRCQETKEADYCGSELFTDMPALTNWAHNAIDWAVFNKITSGTSATTFAPGAGCTRAQVVTFLWRAAGEPEPEKTETGFTDLKPDGYYVKAVAWAVENGITAGVTKDRFAPNNTCTRAQIVTFLYRYENQPEIETAETGFSDVAPAAYYAKAVAWAVENGITAGVSADKFAPNNTCTRAQVVTFLYRDSKLVRPEPTPTPAPTGTPAPTQPTTPEEPTPVENPEDPTPVEVPDQPVPVDPAQPQD